MIGHAFASVLSTARRWNRDRILINFRRLRSSRRSGILLYLFLVFLLLIFVSSTLHYTPAGGSQVQNSKNVREETFENNILKEYEDGGKKKRTLQEKKDSLSLVNPHNYHLMISNAGRCSKLKKINLLVLVTSAAQHLERRRAIRETWGEEEYLSSYGVRLLFLLANPNDLNLQKKIVEEYRTFGDTIQEDFVESYMNLTLKTLMGIKWASTQCQKASFVMKTDDDMFVNIPYLLEHLIDYQGRKIFAGCIKQRRSFQPVNAGMPLPPAHPPFAAGAGYVFSGSLLKELYEASLRTRIIPVEDVYITAHLAKLVGAHPPRHDIRFSCGELVLNDCDVKKVFTGHKVTPDRMRTIWEKVKDNDGICNGLKL